MEQKEEIKPGITPSSTEMEDDEYGPPPTLQSMKEAQLFMQDIYDSPPILTREVNIRRHSQDDNSLSVLSAMRTNSTSSIILPEVQNSPAVSNHRPRGNVDDQTQEPTVSSNNKNRYKIDQVQKERLGQIIRAKFKKMKDKHSPTSVNQSPDGEHPPSSTESSASTSHTRQSTVNNMCPKGITVEVCKVLSSPHEVITVAKKMKLSPTAPPADHNAENTTNNDPSSCEPSTSKSGQA